MDKFINWHKNYFYGLLEKWNISSYQASWLSWLKGIVMGILIMLLCGCGHYQFVTSNTPTEIVYLDELQDSTSRFTDLKLNIISFDIRPLRPRFHWGYNYGYWHTRPMWLDFDYYQGNYYSFNYPYYSYFYRPWNFWDYYFRPWRPYNNWYQGPFNNPGYNVVYNASRRGSLTSSSNRNIAKTIITNRIIKPKPNYTKPIFNFVKPVNNNNNNYKPTNNYSKPSYNTNSKPSYNSRPSYNSKPKSNSSKPNNSSTTSRSKSGRNN